MLLLYLVFFPILLHVQSTDQAPSTVGHRRKRGLVQSSHRRDQDVNSTAIPSYLYGRMFQFLLQHESLVHRCLRPLLQHLPGRADRILLHPR